MAKLGEVCEVSPSTKNIERQGAWLLNLDMVEQQTGRVIEYKYVGEDDLNGSIIQFDTENVLYSKLRPNLNKVVLPPKDGFSTSELLPLRPDASVLNKDYLAAFLRSDSFVTWAVSKTAGAKMPRLGTKDLMNAEIPVPSIEQQKKIAEKFKKLEQLISLRKQQLAKLDELVKARFVEMFGEPVQNPNCWKTENLLDLGYCKNGMNFHRDDCGTEIHCLGVGDFKNHSTIRDVGSLPFISLNELPTSEYLLQDGDIVFVRSNGNKELVGRCLAIYPAKIPVTYSGFCIRYRLTSNKITVSYLLRVLKADSVRKKMTGRGANIQNLNQQILAQLVVPIPPLSLQNQFAAFVERVDQQKQTVQQGLEKLELMKKALMQEYFG
jgi:type I restriction enzyme S subunit